MGRVVAIDYGTKRVGIATTDVLKIIASPLTTIHSKDLISFLKEYDNTEGIDTLVVGMPKNLANQATDLTPMVVNLVKHLRKVFKEKKVVTVDERFTSKIAFESILSSGVKKKDRRNKENIDKISATIILQSYLERGNLT